MTTLSDRSLGSYRKYADDLYRRNKKKPLNLSIIRSLLTEVGPYLYYYNNALSPHLSPSQSSGYSWVNKQIQNYVHKATDDYCNYGSQGMFCEEHIGLLLCASLAYNSRSTTVPLMVGPILNKHIYFHSLLDELDRGMARGKSRETQQAAVVAKNYMNALIDATSIEVIDISGFKPEPLGVFKGKIPVVLIKMKVGNAPERTVMSIMGTATGTTVLTDLFCAPHNDRARKCQRKLGEVVANWKARGKLISDPDYATGHSLGGILSMLCSRLVNIDVIAFSAPVMFPQKFYDNAVDKSRIFLYNHAQDSLFVAAKIATWYMWWYCDSEECLAVWPEGRYHQALIFGDCTESVRVSHDCHSLKHILAPMAYYRSVRVNCTTPPPPSDAPQSKLPTERLVHETPRKSTLAEHWEREKEEYEAEQRERQFFEVVAPTVITAIIDKWNDEHRSCSYAELAAYLQTFSSIAKPALNALKHYTAELFDGEAGAHEALLVEILHGCVISELCRSSNDGRVWCVTVSLLSHGINYALSLHGFDHVKGKFIVNGIVIPVLIRCEPRLFRQFMERFVPPISWSACKCQPPLTAGNVEVSNNNR